MNTQPHDSTKSKREYDDSVANTKQLSFLGQDFLLFFNTLTDVLVKVNKK